MKPLSSDAFAWTKCAVLSVVLVYLASCWPDSHELFSEQGILSVRQVAVFLDSAELSESARWYLSPVWWSESVWAMRSLLVLGSFLCVAALAGRVKRYGAALIWLVLIAVANRYLTLSSPAESLLSLSVFAIALGDCGNSPWWKRTSLTLVKCQFSIAACFSILGMLNGDAWLGGEGAIALAEPVVTKSLDLVSREWFLNPWIHEPLSILILVSLPAGLVLAWNGRHHGIAVGLIGIYAASMALIGSHWLWAFVVTCNSLAFRCTRASNATE